MPVLLVTSLLVFAALHLAKGDPVDVITGPGEMVKELDRRLKVIDRVLRHLVVRVDEALRVADRRKAAREAEAARRREARGGTLSEEAAAPGDTAEVDVEEAEDAEPAEVDVEEAEVE